MRAAFIRTLTEIAEADARVVLLTGDLGFSVMEPFAERFPERFFNVGVAEQNMVGMATGLAEAGLVPFVYSIITFASLRAYEFIRNGPVHHRLPVRIVGIGGGFEYGHAGLTHYGLEDLGVMRLQPGLTVVAPADHQQAANALRATWNLPNPIFYRMGKDDAAFVPGLEGRFALGRMEIVREGADLAIVTIGAIASEAAAAAEILAGQGVNCTVAVVSSFNPSPSDDLAALLGKFRKVMTVEVHYENGGVGSWVAEVIAERGLACQLVRCAVPRTPSGMSAPQNIMENAFGLSREALANTALSHLERHP